MPGFEIGKRKFQIDAGKIFYLRHGKCFESSWNPADKKKRISDLGIFRRIFLAELAGNNPLHRHIIRGEVANAKWVLHTYTTTKLRICTNVRILIKI